MAEIIDLSQEIYAGMPVYKGLPEVQMSVHVAHEEWEEIVDTDTVTPGIYFLQLG